MQRRCLDEFYNGLLDVAEQYIEKVAHTHCLTDLYTIKLLQRDFDEIVKVSSRKIMLLNSSQISHVLSMAAPTAPKNNEKGIAIYA
ncbi:hypothetical protein GF336_04840 [Candidatus Woesearchaeota archaeon]|nr:hypothetical protein [Candidatus Woesearchaeota archaeon]